MGDKLTEFEERIRMIYENCVAYNKGAIGFIADLRQIMPPTCTPNERKFLDEISEKGKFCRSALAGKDALWFNQSCLRQSDFQANLSELVDKKE